MTAIATLDMTEPGGLALALGGACVALAVMRKARTGGAPWMRTVPILTVAAGGMLLAGFGGPAAHALLGMLALAGGGWLTTALYRREAAAVSVGRRSVLMAVRLCAWIVLLTLLARPAWERVEISWDRPVLAVLLDHSSSMAITDQAGSSGPQISRAARANAVMAQARATIDRLDELYDVRLRRFGARLEPTSAWRITPEAPLTALARALRDARELRSAKGQPPRAILIISDGAEKVGDAAAVRQAGEDLASQRLALLAVGVGPEAGQTPLVEFEPLLVPPRVGLRDTLHVPVSGRVQGCRGQILEVEVLWDDRLVAAAPVRIDYEIQHMTPVFDLLSPGPGTHRLLVRVELPAALGGQRFTTSEVVDVAGDPVRVLYVEHLPRTESAFVTRAWRADSNLEVTRHLLFADNSGENAVASEKGFSHQRVGRSLAESWSDYDVVVLGHVRPRLTMKAEAALAQAVTRRGVGLLLGGGQELLNSGEYTHTPLGDLSPTHLSAGELGDSGEVRFIPTDAGLRHPVLQRAASGAEDADRLEAGAIQADESAAWAQLPPLGGAATLGRPKPAAVVLASDEAGRPLLVAHEVGRGRCIIAAWESTWPWALASEEGSAIHRRVWRQMVVWLANRRPRAWVLTDRPEYTLAALADADQRVRIRAGLSGVNLAPSAGLEERFLHQRPTLTLRRCEQAEQQPAARTDSPTSGVSVPLVQTGNEWTAELPDPPGLLPALTPGTYMLEFSARLTDADGNTSARPSATGPTEELNVRTQFVIVAEDVEQRAPTADLSLLRAAAERTSAAGGRYCDIAALPQVLEELSRKDERRRVATRVRYDVVEREPWGLLLWLVFVLGTEWTLRKRSGLA